MTQHKKDVSFHDLAQLSFEDQKKLLSLLTPPELAALYYHWAFWARDNQMPPAQSWRRWVIMAGRGWGKTRCGAEWVRAQVEKNKARRIALVAETIFDARMVMVEGESGLLSISPPWFRPVFYPSKRLLTWPNGATAMLFSAESPDQLRGPQFDAAWCDEIAKWSSPVAWDNLMFGLRLGDDPKVVVTTTPRPKKWIKELMEMPDGVVTRGTSYENRDNLAKAFFDDIIRKYEGTRLGRQELMAEFLEDVPGALWSRGMIENCRIVHASQ